MVRMTVGKVSVTDVTRLKVEVHDGSFPIKIPDIYALFRYFL